MDSAHIGSFISQENARYSLLPNHIPETTIYYGLIWTLTWLSSRTSQKLNNIQTSLPAPIIKCSKQFMSMNMLLANYL